MAISITILVWVGFLSLIAVVVALDLGVFHKKAHVVTLPEALGWTTVWVVLALVFGVFVYYLYEFNLAGWDMDPAPLSGSEAAIQYVTGYVLEKSLSVDNIFVIAMVFAHFQIPLADQHRVLFWGILGAVILRGVMILAGAILIARFDWIIYVLGALLLYSAASMLVMRHDNIALEDSIVVRLARRFYPVTTELHGSRFFVQINGVRTATPLFLALLVVEASDVTFAIDSIPAIFAITSDPFIVFTSNVFAILGLRSLYFVLAGLMEKFRYLKVSLVFLLAFVGVKMLLIHHHPIPNLVSLAIIGGILAVGIIASMKSARDSAELVSPLVDDLEKLAITTYKQARKAIILILGSSVLLLGVVFIVLPGPAIVVIPVGLSILAVEFAWARRWLRQIKLKIESGEEIVGKFFIRSRRREPR